MMDIKLTAQELNDLREMLRDYETDCWNKREAYRAATRFSGTSEKAIYWEKQRARAEELGTLLRGGGH